MFATYFTAAGGRFTGGWKEGRAPRDAIPFVTLESPPLFDVVRDVNKLSNNVMARQVFLTLATAKAPPPATTAGAARAVRALLAQHRLKMPELVLDNGSGLSRRERISAGSLVNLLLAADASNVRDEYASSLAVAATDGTVQRRFQNGTRRRAGALEDRHARRRARDRGLCDRPGRAPLRAGRARQSSERRPRAGRARRPGAMDLPERSDVDRRAGALTRACPSHSRNGLAVLEQQIAADHAIEDPDRRHGPDAYGEKRPEQATISNTQKTIQPITVHSSENQNVRISHARCDATHVPCAWVRFT